MRTSLYLRSRHFRNVRTQTNCLAWLVDAQKLKNYAPPLFVRHSSLEQWKEKWDISRKLSFRGVTARVMEVME